MIGHVELKVIHQSAAALSILGFIIRGGLMIAQSAMLRERWMRSWPHLIDTTLLVSGVWMALNLQFSPANSPWLTAKIVALLIYIALGFVALRLGRTYRARVAAFAAALVCFGYIGLVAVKRSPWPF